MPQYIILIYGDQQRWDTITADEMATIDAGHREFAAKAGSAIRSSGQLEASRAAKSIRGDRSGKPVVTDGPFLETSEVVGGFYVVETPTIDEAISFASLLGEVRQGHGGIEVHPLVNHG